MKAMDEALALADKKGITLEESKRGVYEKKQIWYRRSGVTTWLWYATSWTKAHQRLKDLGRKLL